MGTNQFFNLEERHIFSPTVINTARASFSRTHVNGSATNFNPALDLFPGPGAQMPPLRSHLSPASAPASPRLCLKTSSRTDFRKGTTWPGRVDPTA